MLADEKLFPATGTYNAMLNCLAKNAAVGGATMEDGRELMMAALERGKAWDEQVPLVAYRYVSLLSVTYHCLP